jgi:hypothetical protein
LHPTLTLHLHTHTHTHTPLTPLTHTVFGVLAQLARAFDWQSRGHRFDSDILHNHGRFYMDDGRCSILNVKSSFYFKIDFISQAGRGI